MLLGEVFKNINKNINQLNLKILNLIVKIVNKMIYFSQLMETIQMEMIILIKQFVMVPK